MFNEYTAIAQVIGFFVAGIGAVSYIDRKISATEKRLNSKLIALDKKLVDFVPRRECDLINKEVDRRLDYSEYKIGDMAQKAQIILSSRELLRAKESGIL